MAGLAKWRCYAKRIRVCVLSVSALLYTVGAFATDTTGSLLYAGWDTKKTKQAVGITVDTTSNTLAGYTFTTGTIEVDPGDPFALDWYTTGVKLSGTGGTWNLSESLPTLTFDARPAGTTTYIGDQGACPPDGAPYPAAPSVPFTFYSPVNNNVGFCQDPDTMLDTPFDRYTEPVSYMDIRTTPGANVIYRFTPTAMVFDDNTTYGQSFDIPGQGTECRIRTGSLRLSDGHINVTLGNVAVTTGAVVCGSAPNNNLAYGTNYSINGEFGLFWGDVHAEGTVYGREGVVIGFGRQVHAQDGSLWLESRGDGTTPTLGSQETKVYTNLQGTHFENTLTPSYVNKGSVAHWFNFDDTIATSGSLETSATVNIGGSYEGQATITDTTNSVFVSSSVISATDVVVISSTNDGTGGSGALWVENVSAGAGFNIVSTNAVNGDVTVNWKIIK